MATRPKTAQTAPISVVRRTATKPKTQQAAATRKPAATKAVPAAERKAGHKKQKTIRDSFNMPASDYALIGDLKMRALKSAQHVKKSELLRAGLKMLAAQKDAEFLAALAAVDSIKTGRPPKKGK